MYPALILPEQDAMHRRTMEINSMVSAQIAVFDANRSAGDDAVCFSPNGFLYATLCVGTS